MKQQIQNNKLTKHQLDPQTHEQTLTQTNQKKIFFIKIMQIYLPVRPQTGFHRDEMATSNWQDKRMLASEAKTWDALENIQILASIHTECKQDCCGLMHGWRSRTVSPVRWEARIECVDTDMVYCCAVLVDARAHRLVSFGCGVLLTWKLSWNFKRAGFD